MDLRISETAADGIKGTATVALAVGLGLGFGVACTKDNWGFFIPALLAGFTLVVAFVLLVVLVKTVPAALLDRAIDWWNDREEKRWLRNLRCARERKGGQ